MMAPFYIYETLSTDETSHSTLTKPFCVINVRMESVLLLYIFQPVLLKHLMLAADVEACDCISKVKPIVF